MIWSQPIVKSINPIQLIKSKSIILFLIFFFTSNSSNPLVLRHVAQWDVPVWWPCCSKTAPIIRGSFGPIPSIDLALSLRSISTEYLDQVWSGRSSLASVLSGFSINKRIVVIAFMALRSCTVSQDPQPEDRRAGGSHGQWVTTETKTSVI